MACFKDKPHIISTHVFAEIIGSTKPEQLFLADTGASVSIMPMDLYVTIHPSKRNPLYVSDKTITAANGTKIDCRGMSVIHILLGGVKYTYRYYVCTDAVFPILGADFMFEFDMFCRLRSHCIYMGDQEIPAFDHRGYCKKGQVQLVRDSTIPPQSESVLTATITGTDVQDGTNVIIEREEGTLTRTGALVCKIVAKSNNGTVPVRVMNASDEPLEIPAGSIMGDFEQVTNVVSFGDIFEPVQYQQDECTCNCQCTHSIQTLISGEADQQAPSEPRPRIRRKKRKRNNGTTMTNDTPSLPVKFTEPYSAIVPTSLPSLPNDLNLPVTGTRIHNVTTVSTTSPCCHSLMQLTVDQRYAVIAELKAAPPSRLNAAERADRTTIPEHVIDLYDRSTSELTSPQKSRLAALLTEYHDRFAAHPDDVGRTTLLKHHIDTGDEPPVRQRCRRFAKCHIEAIQEHVRKLSEAGIIRPSTSEWASNCVVVKKKDGSWRLCIDYRELNEKTKNPDSYLLPRIDDTLDALANARKFCTLDLVQGYHQVELTDSSKEKTAFHAPFCNPSQWEYVYMPFGLVKAPRTFQRLMDRVIQGLEYRVALAYIDDIIVYGRTIDSCIDSMQLVLERLRNANLKLKAKKCILFADEVEYLGHVITGNGVKTDPKKIEAVKEWHPPRTPRQVRSFLGIATYYNRFIRDFVGIAHSLHELTKKGIKFRWTDEHQKAFETIKERLITAPIMAYPQRKGMFILDTDASDRSYGAVLSQLQTDDDGNEVERVIAYASKKFNGTEQMYCARRRELLAIIRSVKHFNVYLRGPTFLIRTDHASLRFIKTVRDLPAQFFRWIMFLEEYSYRIEIRKGILHGNADAMSRGCHGKGCICDELVQWERRMDVRKGTVMIGGIMSTQSDAAADELTPVNSTCCIHVKDEIPCYVAAMRFQPKYSIKELAEMQEQDTDIAPVLKAKRENSENRPPWNEISSYSAAAKSYFAEWKRLCLYQTALYRLWENNAGTRIHRQLIVPRTLQKEFCEKVHDTARTAHMGRRRMIHSLQHFCYWYRMYDDILWWIKSCVICQKRKRLHPTPKAPMTVYVPGEPGERVSIDVCGPMVETPRGNRFILVISDHFSKYTKAVPMPDQQAETVARALINHWILEYGEPMQLHSDQGRNFESNLIEQFCKLHGMEKTRTTPYHPQADGQVERFNKTLVDLVCKLAGKTVEWDERVPLVAAAYNGTIHDSTGYTPNRLMKGKEIMHTQSKIIPDPDKNETRTYHEYVQKLKENYLEAFDSTREALRKSALVQKKYYDRKAHLYKYKPGQAVWITNHAPPEVPGSKKFTAKYIGPYWIIDVLSDIHFRIQEKPGTAPKVIHHDRLKLYIFREPTETPDWVKKLSRELSAAELAKAAERSKQPTQTPVPATNTDSSSEPATQSSETKRPDVPPEPAEPTRKRKFVHPPIPAPRKTVPPKRVQASDKKQRLSSASTDDEVQADTKNQVQPPGTTEPPVRTRAGRVVKPNPKYQ